MINKFLKHSFLRAIVWIYIATLILSVGQYFFHLLMARMLGPQQFGILESAISLLYIFSIPLVTISLVIVKYVSQYKAKNNFSAIHGLFSYFSMKIIIFGSIAVVLLVATSSYFASFLHLPSQSIMVILIFGFIFGLLVQLNRSILQGLLNFTGMTVTNAVETIVKLLLAVVFVYLGMRVNGALLALILSGLFSYGISFIFLKTIWTYPKGVFEKRELFSFTLPVFVSSITTTSFFTTDIILVRHYLPPVEAGYYAAIALLGKIIYYGVSPVIQVMFPMIAEAHAKAQKHAHYLFLSIGFTLLGAGIVTAGYFVFPQFMISMLFGEKYLPIAPLIGYFGIFMLLYSLNALISNYFLSIHKTRHGFFLSIAAVSQIVMISLYHTTLLQVIFVSTVVMFALLISLLVYYVYLSYTHKKEKTVTPILPSTPTV